MKKEEAKSKIAALTAPFESDIGNMLLDLGLELIACGEDSRITKDDQEIGQIDFILKDDEVERIFLIEISTAKTKVSEKISHFFSRWSSQNNIDIIRNQFGLPHVFKIVRIFFELSGAEKTSHSISHLLSEDNKILLKYDFDYFLDAFKKVGEWAKNDFFSYLEIKPRRPRVITGYPAIQFYLESVRLYLYVDRVDRLLKYCYIFRRIKDDKDYQRIDKGYQRILEKGRIGDIARKIEGSKLLAFPNAILISCSDDATLCSTPKNIEECPASVQINIPDCYCACRVIDGQHRLLGFAKLSKNIQKTHYLPVIAFEEIDQHKEMRTFIDINSTQRKIDRNLILVLEADFNWDKKTNRKEFFEKIAVLVVKRLNENSVLKEKIFIPEAMAKKKGKITLTTLVTAIMRNNFIGGKLHLFQRKNDDVEKPYKDVRKIFSLMRQHLPKYCADTSSFFLTNKGLRLLFRLVQLHQRNKKARNITFSREGFIKDLKSIIDDKYITKLEDYYGEGGVTKATHEIVRVLKRHKRSAPSKAL